MILAAAAVALASCGGNAPRRSAQQETGAFKPDIHNAETSLDYRGTYRGVLPAADCPGIETTLTLKPDGTYSLHEEYLERDARFDAEGAYTLHGNLLTLDLVQGRGEPAAPADDRPQGGRRTAGRTLRTAKNRRMTWIKRKFISKRTRSVS